MALLAGLCHRGRFNAIALCAYSQCRVHVRPHESVHSQSEDGVRARELSQDETERSGPAGAEALEGVCEALEVQTNATKSVDYRYCLEKLAGEFETKMYLLTIINMTFNYFIQIMANKIAQ